MPLAPAPTPADDEVHVFLLRPHEGLSRRSVGLWLMLDRDERARARGHAAVASAEWFVAVHGLVRSVVGGALGVDPRSLRLARRPGGKPFLAAPPGADALRFSLSHTAALGALALARGREVGVDVEDVRTVDHAAGLASRYLSPEEALALSTVPAEDRARAFLRAWTRLESRLKAEGAGLDAVATGDGLTAADGGPRWDTVELAVGAGQVGAVTVERGAPARLVLWRVAAAPEGAADQFTFQRTELTANAT